MNARSILLAGLLGGAAEVVWIGIYAWLTPIEGVAVSRAVATTVFPALADPLVATLSGVAIHFALSVATAVLFCWLVWRPLANVTHGLNAAILASLIALAGVWAVNFLVLLPLINPAFVLLLPYSVTLVSKLIFGVAMGWALYHFSNEPDFDR